MAKISIIIPVYNVEQYIHRCLDSVLNQSMTDIEILCVDDCSTDKSLCILNDYAQKDSRIKVFKNEKNLRAAGTRNVGLENALGDYIYFLDADDYIEDKLLQEIYEKAVATNADIATNTRIIKEMSEASIEYIHPSLPEIPENGCFIDNKTAIEQTLCVVWTSLYRRAFLENYKIRFLSVNMTEDNVFHYLTNFYASKIFVFRGEFAYHYLIRKCSVSDVVKSENQFDYLTIKASDIIFDYLKEHDLLGKNKAKLYRGGTYLNVDTEEKFLLYKSFLQKIKPYMDLDRENYSELEWFFADAILSSENIFDYKNSYPANIGIAYLRQRKKK